MGKKKSSRKVQVIILIALCLVIMSLIIIIGRKSLVGNVVLKNISDTNKTSLDNAGKNQATPQPGNNPVDKNPVVSQNNEPQPWEEIFNEQTKGSSNRVYPYQVQELHQKKYVSSDLADQALGSNSIRVIVRLKNNGNKQELLSILRGKKEFKDYVSGTLQKGKMFEFIKKYGDEAIEQIAIDHVVSLAADKLIEQVNAEQVWNSGFTGKGQSVCVIDSGIDYNHPGLSGKYDGGYDFVNNDNDPLDDNGHGTYVSGIIARIAPDSKIIAVKVFNQEGNAYESDIIKGIDYCIQNREQNNISIILMAFGGGVYNTSCYCDSNFVSEEANLAVSQGLFAIAASGNDGDDYLKAPGCGSNVTSVGAVDEDDNVASFTNIEPLLDLLAPGVGIESAKIGGGLESRSGTSASAAVAAGVSALILEKEALAPLELQYRLKSTGVPVPYRGKDYPRADSFAALMNDITNTPAEQEGTQCEGTWDEYETLLSYCPDCETQCWGTYYYDYVPTGGCDIISMADCQECVTSDACATLICDIPHCAAPCNDTQGCGSGFCDTGTCTCNYVTDCSGSSDNCFYIKNSSNSVVARFDKYGNLDLKGWVLSSQTKPCAPTAGSFIIKNSTGACVAYINSSGGLWLGSTAVKSQSSCNPTPNSFIIKNSTGGAVAFINSSGYMCLKGIYLNNSPMS